jgi:uncharacterized BrkB/YihY/UPF0761 family membrane protein
MKKEDALKALDTINCWISNCDNKSSIILGLYGIIITIFLSTETTRNLIEVIKVMESEVPFLMWIYCIFLVASLVVFIYGIFRLIKVLLPKIDTKKPSIMFFGSVTTYECFEYYKYVAINKTEEELLDDVLGQVYAASKICSQKFLNHKSGLLISGIGLTIFTVMNALSSLVPF